MLRHKHLVLEERLSELLLVEDVFKGPADEADPNSVEHDRSVEEHLSVLSFFWIQSSRPFWSSKPFSDLFDEGQFVGSNNVAVELTLRLGTLLFNVTVCLLSGGEKSDCDLFDPIVPMIVDAVQDDHVFLFSL